MNELRARIDAAVPPVIYAETHPDYDNDAYGNTAEYAAKVLLAVASREPQRFKKALDTFRQSPYGDALQRLMTLEERETLFEGRYGLSGFQWGWAVNAAAHLTEQAPVPNPALLEIR